MTGAGAQRTGVWLVGARGSVATTAVAGCAALAAGLHEPLGMVTETAGFDGCGLPPLDALVFGGHDIAEVSLPKRAQELVASGVLPSGVPDAVHRELAAAENAVRPGGRVAGDVRDDDELIAVFAEDIGSFVREHGLARAVVVNVASTEPAGDPGDPGGARLPASALYAVAALRSGCPYVNFTPSAGIDHPALAEAAAASGLPFAGKDGKTGQSLLRSALGPMFRQRAMAVRAWSGANLLGGGDGAALADPDAAAAKNAGKTRVLTDTLGHLPEGEVHIDNVPALGDWKTAWDHTVFDGFLGTRMVMQTLWQGCDSALAAPLVLDLARLTAAAHAAGLSGPLPGLAFFFKDPPAGSPGDLADQWSALMAFAEQLREAV
nr:inositol-3-phosphate synthase [Streptomyces solincola]